MEKNTRIALITGASRGIGLAIALGLGREGITVVGTATTQEGADNIRMQFEKNGIQGTGISLNVADQESIDAALALMKERYGMPTILVNNAAITQDNLLLRMKDDEWLKVIETNLNSIYRLSKACLRDMLRARWGRIINITSVVGVTGNPGQVNYSAAKAGLIGFTKSLAQEVGSRDITVNAVAPGFIDTDMTRGLAEEQRAILLQKIPMQRLGQPEDIANTVVFLVSDSANYITGQTLHVNGGMYMA
ncbi:MAG TPA: 3-oxoacyl-ACP reductase FabG [Gammaproteobacteria bacterium]|nr:3-oxoacyl-ACP reductase FabG [Gammaproteobacteria bacterium]